LLNFRAIPEAIKRGIKEQRLKKEEQPPSAILLFKERVELPPLEKGVRGI